MSPILALAATLLIGYVSGSLPWGLWLGQWIRGVDVRTIGSGNLGATNVYRSLGPPIGVATLVLDIAKGALPVWLLPHSGVGTAFPGGAEVCALTAAIAAVAGHMWTFLAGFKGGKGVATSGGVALALSPPAFGVYAAVFIVVLLLTRYVSLGSMIGAVAFAVALGRFGPSGTTGPTFAVGVLLALLVIVRHKDNIRRLLKGEERRFSFTRGKP
jgi:glycerol-3-phosphate acyltransferase PlsY